MRRRWQSPDTHITPSQACSCPTHPHASIHPCTPISQTNLHTRPPTHTRPLLLHASRQSLLVPPFHLLPPQQHPRAHHALTLPELARPALPLPVPDRSLSGLPQPHSPSPPPSPSLTVLPTHLSRRPSPSPQAAPPQPHCGHARQPNEAASNPSARDKGGGERRAGGPCACTSAQAPHGPGERGVKMFSSNFPIPTRVWLKV